MNLQVIQFTRTSCPDMNAGHPNFLLYYTHLRYFTDEAVLSRVPGMFFLLGGHLDSGTHRGGGEADQGVLHVLGEGGQAGGTGE